MDDSALISRWLEAEAAQRLLGRISQQVASDLATSKIQPPFLELPHGSQDDVLAILKSELTVFILENRANIKALIIARDSNLPRYLQLAFLNRCRDLARRSGLDPRRYFRKRAAEVFRQSPRFHRALKDGRFIMFSLDAASEEVRLPQEFDLCAIGPPGHLAESLDYSAACKENHLVDLAVHFWNCLCEILQGRRIWIDLRDFVRWVACFVPMHVALESAERRGSSEDQESFNPDLWDTVTSEDPPLPPPSDEQLEALASAFVARLNQKDRAIFYYRLFEEMKWEDVAHLSGYKGPSGPLYRFEQTKDTLRELLREWPGLSPEDEDREAEDLFMEKLHMILKKSLSAS
jgi:hypothetical protein